MAERIVKKPKSATNNRRISDASVALAPSEVEKQLIKAPVGKAEQAIGKLRSGCNILGVTKGQFSMLDLLRACLDQTGPADVMLSTWTFGVRDAEMAAWLVTAGVIRRFRFLVDHSFPQREVKYCKRLRELFGDDCIVLSKIHAKVATVRNDRWNLCITGSMNLNRNPRWEHFTISDDAAACDFLDGIEAELRDITGARWDVKDSEVGAAFDKAGMDETNALVEAYLKEQAEGGRPKGAARPMVPLADPAAVAIPSRLDFLEQEYRRLDVAMRGAIGDHHWGSVDKISSQKNKVYRELLDARQTDAAAALTPTEAAARLEEMAFQAPLSVQARIFQRILQAHPDWAEEGAWSEA
jgi:hypothetical protein